jgi:protein TonB
MPQELLRDVLRTGDASGRVRRRLSVLPLSIAAHAMIVALFVMSPLAEVIDLPTVSSPLQAARYMETVAPPAPPPPKTEFAPREPSGAPLKAPEGFTEETPVATPDDVDGGVVPGPGVHAGPPLLPGLNMSGPPAVPVVAPPPQPKIVRVGQGVREPKKLVHVAPEYPVIAQRARVQGTVVLEAVLDVTGRVDRVRVLRSEPLLDEAAIKAVRQWRYTPTELNGVPVPVLMTITVHFSLAQE